MNIQQPRRRRIGVEPSAGGWARSLRVALLAVSGRGAFGRPRGIRRSVTAALSLAALLGSLLAQPVTAQPLEADPPGRVARVADLTGTVWLYHPDAGDWVQATRNLPLTTGDTLATEPGARAELQVGSATFGLDSGSELGVDALDDNRLSLQLRAGAMAVRVRNAAETGPLAITTDEGRFLVLGAGQYRFDRGTASSFVGVESGSVRYEYASSALTVSPGQRAEFWIDANGTAQYGLGGPVYDAFAAWNNERDRATDRSLATRFASPEMTGIADLDRYGNWEQSADVGAVWVPATVAADWAPYSTGRWAWIRPWGWTWVDDAPWGFAPFHYGRWINLRNRWCWSPGVRQPRPVYAPALVAWVGSPRGGVGVGAGPAVGWFPLAPREVFVPPYRSSPRYIRGLNAPDVRVAGSIDLVLRSPAAAREFENRRYPGALTIVPAAAFAEHRSLAPVAAQYRDAPWARDVARGSAPAPVLNAPPVAAPPSLWGRQTDDRPHRPAPGFANPAATARDRFGRPSGAESGDRFNPPAAPSLPAQRPTQPAQPEAPPDASRMRPFPVIRGNDRREEEAAGRPGDERNRGRTSPPRGDETTMPPTFRPGVPTSELGGFPVRRPGAEPPNGFERGGANRPPAIRQGDRSGVMAPPAEAAQPMQPQPQLQQPQPSRPQPNRPELVAPRTPDLPAPSALQPRPPPQPMQPTPPVRPPANAGLVPVPAPPQQVEAPARPAPAPAEAPRVAAPERRNDPNTSR